MEFKLFEEAGMIALKKDSKWGLFVYHEDGESAELVPVDFAQNLNSLEVYFHDNLVVTSEGVYTLTGEKLSDSGTADVRKVALKNLIITQGGTYGTEIIIWDGRKVLFKSSCSEFRYSSKYLALAFRTVWSLFKIDGTPIDEGAFQADDVEIHSDFLIAKSLGKQSLYSFRKEGFIKKDQTRIVCSDECNLVLCARVGENALNVLSAGRWHQIPGVGEFDILHGMGHLFYIKRGDKYFLYEENAQRFMKHLYPDGMDFVACNENGLLMVLNNGEPVFFNQA